MIAYITFRTPLFSVRGGGTSIPDNVIERFETVLLECTYNTKEGERMFPQLFSISSEELLALPLKRYAGNYRREVPFSKCVSFADKNEIKRLKAKAINVKITW